MKKLFFLTVALMAGLMLHANIVADETFTDFPAAWKTSGSVTTDGGIERTQAAALTYSNEGGVYALSGKGNAVVQAYNASDKYFHTKALETPLKTDFYLSFMVRPDGEQKASQAQVFGLSNTETSAALRIWIGKDTGGSKDKCRVGITRSSGKGADVQWGNGVISVNETHLLVVKYTISETDTIAALYIDPVIGGADPAEVWAQDGEKSAAKSTFKYFCFYSTGNTKTYCTVGGVRIATTWAEAVAASSSQTTPMTVVEEKAEENCTKAVENGHMVIYRGGKKYNLSGIEL